MVFKRASPHLAMPTLQLGGLRGAVRPCCEPPILLYITSKFAHIKHLFCWQLILIFLYLTSAWMFFFLTLATAFPTFYLEFENSALMHAHSTSFPVLLSEHRAIDWRTKPINHSLLRKKPWEQGWCSQRPW